jgi:superfamily II DNA/RNA helicase
MSESEKKVVAVKVKKKIVTVKVEEKIIPVNVEKKVVAVKVNNEKSEVKADKKIDDAAIDKKVKFSDLGLSEKMLAKITQKGYEYPSAVQAAVIPLLLKGNKDIIGQAQTGTGKTAAFALPILERLDPQNKSIQAMILAPTRELAIQVAEEIKSFADSSVKVQLLYGGQSIRDELM